MIGKSENSEDDGLLDFDPEKLANESSKVNFSKYLRSRLYTQKHKQKVNRKFKNFISRNNPIKVRKRTKSREVRKKKLPPLIKRRPLNIDMSTSSSPTSSRNGDNDIDSIPINFRSSSDRIRKLSPISSLSSSIDSQIYEKQMKGKREKMSVRKERTKNKLDFERFIAKMLRNPSSMEFIYLNRSKEAKLGVKSYNPYDLVITNHSNIRKNDYYTLGSKGVTHFNLGKAEFTKLETWLNEKTLFEKILNLNFFQKYRIFKSFFYMKKYVNGKHRTMCKKNLKSDLFILNPVLSKPLIEVRQKCIEIKDIELFKDVSGTTCEAKKFREIQANQRKECSYVLKNKITEIVEIIKNACKDSIEEAGFGDRFNDLSSMMNFKEDIGEKSKPIVLGKASKKLKEELSFTNEEEGSHYQMSFTDLSQKKRVCKKLVNFIKLCEYLVVDSLLNLNKRSVEFILEKMKHLGKVVHIKKDCEGGGEVEDNFDFNFSSTSVENTPLLFVEIILQKGNVTLAPEKYCFEELINHVMNNFLKVIQIDRILLRPEFEEYVEYTAETGAHNVEYENESFITSFIHGDPSIKKLKINIKHCLDLNFKRIREYMKSFEPLRQMYFENEKSDISMIVFPENMNSIGLFMKEMKKYKEQISMVNAMRKTNDCGIFTILTKKLKDTFAPSPRNCLDDYHKFLPLLAEKLNKNLFELLKKKEAYLSTNPTKVEDFVDYCKFLTATKTDIKDIDDDYITITNLFSLMEKEDVKVNMTKREDFTIITSNKYSRLKKTIEFADEQFEDRKTKFGLDISNQIADLRSKMREVNSKGRDLIIYNVDSKPEAVLKFLFKLKETIDKTKLRLKELVTFQEMFKLKTEEIKELDEIENDIGLKILLWNSLQRWDGYTKNWKVISFEDLNAEDMKKSIDEFQEVSRRVEKALVDNDVVSKFSTLVDEWKELHPIISSLKNPNFKTRHFRKINKIFGENIFSEEMKKKRAQKKTKKEEKKNNEFDGLNGEEEEEEEEEEEVLNLEFIMSKNFIQKADLIEKVSSEASNEASLEEMVKKVKSNWVSTPFNIATYKEYYILGDSEEIVTQIEDDEIVISMILSSPYVKAIKTRVEKWSRDLKLMYDVINQWNKLQVKWLYLESVFSSGDTNMQEDLYEEHQKFKEISRFFKEQMKRTNERRNVLNACTQNIGLFEKLKSSNSGMEFIEKKLEQYLDRKRNLFPRLYFLSNDDLLDILSKSKDPSAVQPHLEKCFDNIKSLKIQKKGFFIRSMVSDEGEEVKFLSKSLQARGPIEEWLKSVEANMITTMKHLTKKGIKDFTEQEKQFWISNHKCQVVLTVNQVFWVKGVEKCLTSSEPLKNLKKFHKICQKNLNALAVMSRTRLPPLTRHTVKTLIILEVHGTNVVEEMIKEGVCGINDFGWLKQLRYYWDEEENDCLVKQSNSVFRYGYEYIGCKGRLVITPLTDRIYMTMTGALHLKMGGAPAGPAGTGKTETVKDLAKALGYQCVVFNCSDGVTYKMMYKFFSGIVQTGAWTCFDEFNRIDIEVLSVIATQILTIQDALKRSLTHFLFEEGKDKIMLKHTAGIFITMNPGYAGRSELPDNLKALFRPVACMLPDYQIIAEVILYSEGYEDAKNLSRKMVQLYKLSNEQLSAQFHYDFGMRAIKSVLVMAGELKRSAEEGEPEEKTLTKAMKDSNLPKFVGGDIILFEAIVSDLFPNLVVEEKINQHLVSGIKDVLAKKGLQPVPKFIKKIVQLFDTMIVRHGVMIVGPTCSGKTMAREVLAETLTYLKNVKKMKYPHFQVVQQKVLNPKSISYSELYGKFNLLTHEFLIGIIPYFAKQFNKLQTKDKKWIIFDGPVDTLWIESMNSVLDDSRILCLDNADTIRLNKTLHMLFEVEDLAVASPATVSRCGMVWMDSHNLSWKAILSSWMKELKGDPYDLETKKYIREMFNDGIEASLKFIRSNCKEVIPSNDVNLVKSFTNLFNGLIKESNIDFERFAKKKKAFFANLFLFVLTWSVGSNILEEDRKKFDIFIMEKMDKHLERGFKRSVFEYCFDLEDNRFVEWSDIVPKNFEFDPSVPYHKAMVPTKDTVVFSHFAKVLTSTSRALLFCGETGTGKTSILTNTFAKNGKEENGDLELVPIQFSARTSSKRTKQAIESKLVSRKNVLKPPGGCKRVVLFIDDLNMPEPEKFGAQPPLELLRQFLQYKGFYDLEDRDNIFFKNVEGTSCIAACGIPGGGKHHLSKRITRMFHLFFVPELSCDSMERIFKCILEGFLKKGGFVSEIRSNVKNYVKSAVELYGVVKDAFRPTPTTAHYTFNLRDLSKVFQGIIQVKKAQMKGKKDFIKLFIHENLRCYYDRLTCVEDREKFCGIFTNNLKKNIGGFDVEGEEVFGDNEIIFSTLLKPKEKTYMEIKDRKRIPKELDDALGMFNIHTSGGKMDLVFFKNAASSCIKIVRILQQSRGNALLVGVGGSGKQSLTRLAAHFVSAEVFEIKIKRKYSIVEFREDIQVLFKNAGEEGKKMVFLFTDNHIVNDAFLEDVNNILNSGEVPNLFPNDEKEKIINKLRPIARAGGIPETREEIYKYFIERVRNNLHVVLCLSPIGDKFRIRCRMFPSLVNCCTIIWFDSWPTEAIKSVAERKFEKIRLNNDDIKDELIKLCVFIYGSVCSSADMFYEECRRRFYVTPAKFLQFINVFSVLLEQKRAEKTVEVNKLKKGLNILKKTNEEVKKMQKELEDLKPVLLKKTEIARSTREKVTKAKAIASKRNLLIAKEEKIVSEKTKKAVELAALAKKELDKAIPDLRRAEQALGGLTKSSIAEIRNYSKPPPAVDVVLRATQIIYGAQKSTISFAEGVKLLSSPGFVNTCKTFDATTVKDSIIKTLKKKIFPNPLFNRNEVKKQSQAAEILCVWIRAVVKFHDVNKTVIPLKKKKAIAEKELKKMKSELKKKQDELKTIQEKVDKLNKTYEKNTLDMKNLSNKTETCKRRLESASKLMTLLGSEEKTWGISLERLSKELDKLPGNIILASACVAFFGPFSSKYRTDVFKLWVSECIRLKVPFFKNKCSLIDVLGDPVLIREWVISKLPSDNQSIENALITFNTDRFPLMIDPQTQGNTFIKSLLKKNIKVMWMRDNFISNLRNAIGVGTPVIIENVSDRLDQSIDPFLNKQLKKHQGRIVMQIGEENVSYNRNFRLFLTTKMSNPHYLPDICNKTCLINFMVTTKGLEDQLLSLVVSRLEKSLEESRDKLIIRMARNEKQLKQLRRKILTSLSSVGNRNILDDEKLIKTLDESKFSQNIVEQSYKEAIVQEKSINEARKKYRKLATRGSILYFVVSKIAAIDPMYQYSLEYFKELFTAVIDNTLKNRKSKFDSNGKRSNADTEELLGILMKSITQDIFENISRGLFEKDKLILSFLFSIAIQKEEKQLISEKEYDFFLRGIPDLKSKSPLQASIDSSQWGMVVSLERQLNRSFSGIVKSIIGAKQEWEEYLSKMTGFDTPLPGRWKNLSVFQKLILIKCLKEEKLVHAMKSYISESIGDSFIKSIPLDLSKAIETCKPYTPIIFILSTGADPTEIIKRFAREQGYEDKLLIKSLGQGQEESARRCIARGKSKGCWVMLQNCHLAISFMPELEQVIMDIASSSKDKENSKVGKKLKSNENDDDGVIGPSVHPNFRLWLTSMPTAKFPVQILQNGIKITVELPKGIKANLSRSYNNTDEKYFNTFDENEVFDSIVDEERDGEKGVVEYVKEGDKYKKHIAFKRLLFGLCVFNAVINERKKFGPCGWTKVYDFNDADLKVAQLWLQIFLKEHKEIPWKSLRYVIGEIVFGGRVTDPFDKRLILDILDQFFCSDVLSEDYEWGNDDVYKIPMNIKGIEEFKKYILSIKDNDSPDIFKMNENADIVFQLQESSKYLNTLRIVDPKSVKSKGNKKKKNEEDEDEVVKSRINKILSMIPMELNKSEAGKDTFKIDKNTGALHSLSSVLSHEIERFNKLLKVVKSSLKEILKALDGLVVLSSKMEILLSQILNGELPTLWCDVGYPSLKGLDAWLIDLGKRIAFLRKWLVEGTPKVFWISGFFFPQGFLTGVLQTHSRKHKIPIDTLSFTFKLIGSDESKIDEHPEDGVYVSGLYLDGARYNEEEKCIEEPGKKIVNPYPVVQFIPTQNSKGTVEKEGLYECPLYKTSERKGSLSSWGCSTNFVCAVDLPTKKNQSFWTLQGLALVCQLDK